MTASQNAWTPKQTQDLERKRDIAIERLTQAFASDLVPIESYEKRVAMAQTARNDQEIEAAIAGLAAGRDEAPVKESSRPQEKASSGLFPFRIDPRLFGSSTTACILGNSELNGDWLEGDTIESFTLLGSARLDLRETALPQGRLKIDAFVMMGDVKIIVPPGLPVKLNGIPFMGDLRTDREITRRVEPGQPFLEINAFVLMGSLRVICQA